jgi:hypothetical protein
MGALASYSVIACWSLLLTSSLNVSNWNLRLVTSFITIFTMAHVALIPLYWLRIRNGYLAGTVVGLSYMIGGFFVDFPPPWVTNPNPLNVLGWGMVYSIGALGVYFILKSYQGA